MTDAAKFIESLAALAWPAVAVLLIFMFRPALVALIESARSRKFTLKIGGQELSMEEANEQQSSLIADLQAQVLEIRKKIEMPVTHALAREVQSSAATSARAVLWVTDKPKDTSYFVQQLIDRGVSVDAAPSTSEALRLFHKRAYGLIVSGLARDEDGRHKATAGLDLLREVRETNKTIPFVLFCGNKGLREHKEEALKLGVTAITSSGTEISGILRTAFEEKA